MDDTDMAENDSQPSKLITVSSQDHAKTLADGLFLFLQTQHGVDFNFRSGDGQFVSAHKLILEVFLQSGKFLESGDGITVQQYEGSNSNLGALLEFMYKGRVTVTEKEFEGLVRVAKELDFRMLLDAVQYSTSSGDAGSKVWNGEITMNNESHIENKESEVSLLPVSLENVKRTRNSHLPESPTKKNNLSVEKGKLARPSCHSGRTRSSRASTSPLIKVKIVGPANRKAGDAGVGRTQRSPIKPEDPALQVKQTSRGKSVNQSQVMDPSVFEPILQLVETETECPKDWVDQQNWEAEFGSGAGAGVCIDDHWDRQVDKVKVEPVEEVVITDSIVDERSCGEGSIGSRDPCSPESSSSSSSPSPSNSSSASSSSSSSHGNVKVTPTMTPTKGGTSPTRKPYRCVRCQFKTAKYKAYRLHLLSLHEVNANGEPAVRHRCPEPNCGYESVFRSHVKAHRLSKHTKGASNLKCPHCDCPSSHRTALRRHLDVVHGLGPGKHKCEICGKRCQSRFELGNHMRSHTKDKPFKCSMCSYAAVINSNLTRHQSVVHGLGASQYSCETCRKRFFCNSDLVRHRRIHSSERPFKCPHCNHTAKLSSHLKTHLKNIHKIERKPGEPRITKATAHSVAANLGCDLLINCRK